MKTLFTTLLLTTFGFMPLLWAQPANDNCSDAQNLILGTPPPCPSGAGVTNNFPSTNINATPATPYPSFNGCSVGGSTAGPAAEVWYRFVPNSNRVTINVNGGLMQANIVLFQGDNCAFLNVIDCASGGANVALTASVVQGNLYYILVSGGNVNDQGNFNLSITSFRDCSPCLQSADLQSFPPPVDYTYASGQNVTFCFTIDGWNATGTIEWLHAVEFEFADGWDVSNLIAIPPASCGGDGTWAWYNSWTSCHTGQTFGPGFAYDSSSGMGCNGSANDGNPGNNWGDGASGCSNITPANAFTFCVTVAVNSCPPDLTGTDDLGLRVRVFSDGSSGSWTQTGCNSGIEYPFFAIAVCCADSNLSISPQAAFTANGNLGEATVQFGNTSTNATDYEWFFGDGTESTEENPSHTYEADGTYTVTLVAHNTCSNDTMVQEVTIILLPTATFTQSESNGCEGLSVDFTAAPQGEGLTYAWTFEGGNPASSDEPNPTVSYAVAGTYDVQLIVSNAAGADTVAQNGVVTVSPNPQAAFTANGNLGEAVVQFGNTSTDASSYQWFFGDDTESIEESPSHTYEADGTYTITLVANNACGSDTSTQEVTILLPPTATFTQNLSSGCEGLSVDFTATPQGEGLTYAWTFEGGSPGSSDLPNPTVSYAAAGTYDVQLIVSNAAGSDTIVQNDVVNVLGGAAADFSAAVNGFNVNFENNSIGGSAYFWDFGDENTSDAFAPSHVYEENGVFLVTLIAVNACGNDTISIEITIDSALPVAAFSFENSKGCVPLVVQFLSESVNADSVHWTFPGGTPGSSDELNPTITYTTPGIYNATIVAYNMAGSATLTQMNIVEVEGITPNAAFDITQDEGIVSFANISENADSYEWHFGDGQTSTESDPVHEYSQSGDYLVQLIATNLCGSDTMTKEVNVVIVSIEEVAQRLDFKLYPNPNSGNFMLEMEAAAAPWLDLKIYDALGRLVYEKAMEFRSGELQKPVNLANATAGVYWITLQTEAFNITRKVMIGY